MSYLNVENPDCYPVHARHLLPDFRKFVRELSAKAEYLCELARPYKDDEVIVHSGLNLDALNWLFEISEKTGRFLVVLQHPDMCELYPDISWQRAFKIDDGIDRMVVKRDTLVSHRLNELMEIFDPESEWRTCEERDAVLLARRDIKRLADDLNRYLAPINTTKATVSAEAGPETANLLLLHHWCTDFEAMVSEIRNEIKNLNDADWLADASVESELPSPWEGKSQRFVEHLSEFWQSYESAQLDWLQLAKSSSGYRQWGELLNASCNAVNQVSPTHEWSEKARQRLKAHPESVRIRFLKLVTAILNDEVYPNLHRHLTPLQTIDVNRHRAETVTSGIPIGEAKTSQESLCVPEPLAEKLIAELEIVLGQFSRMPASADYLKWTFYHATRAGARFLPNDLDDGDSTRFRISTDQRDTDSDEWRVSRLELESTDDADNKDARLLNEMFERLGSVAKSLLNAEFVSPETRDFTQYIKVGGILWCRFALAVSQQANTPFPACQRVWPAQSESGIAYWSEQELLSSEHNPWIDIWPPPEEWNGSAPDFIYAFHEVRLGELTQKVCKWLCEELKASIDLPVTEAVNKILRVSTAESSAPSSKPFTSTDLETLRKLLESFRAKCQKCQATLQGKAVYGGYGPDRLWREARGKLQRIWRQTGNGNPDIFNIDDDELDSGIRKVSDLADDLLAGTFSREVNDYGESAIGLLGGAASRAKDEGLHWLPEPIDDGKGRAVSQPSNNEQTKQDSKNKVFPDGPATIEGKLYLSVNSELSEPLTAKQYVFVKAVWNAKDKTIDRQDLADPVYDDHEHEVTLAAARSFQTKINAKIEKLHWKLRVPSKPPHVFFEKISNSSIR